MTALQDIGAACRDFPVPLSEVLQPAQASLRSPRHGQDDHDYRQEKEKA
jgi:hypothetical protein